MIDKEGVTPIKKKKKFVYLEKYEAQVEAFESHIQKLNSRINELYIGLIIISTACAGLLFMLNQSK